MKQTNTCELKLIEFVEKCPQQHDNRHVDYIRRSPFGIYSKIIIILGATVIICTNFFPLFPLFEILLLYKQGPSQEFLAGGIFFEFF